MDCHRGKCNEYKPVGHVWIVPIPFPKCTHTLTPDGEPFIRECSIQVAGSWPTKTCILECFKDHIQPPTLHTRHWNFNNPYLPTIGVPSLSFPNRGNINSTIQCPKPMICVVADLAIMSTSYENAMPNAMSFNINALKCIIHISWHSHIQYNKYVQSINSMLLNL